MQSRRTFLKSASLASVAFAARPFLGQAAPPMPQSVLTARAAAATARLSLSPLRGNVSVLQGSGGNIAVLAGTPSPADRPGKLLVDSGYATSQPHIQEALRSLDPHPVRHLINTHWHVDHTDGNLWLHDTGATITAHQNTLKHLSKAETIGAFNAVYPPAPPAARPTDTFNESYMLTANSESLALYHYDPAHTDGDISVHFLSADVLHTGDTWFNGTYPFIDYSTGGSIDGMIKATDWNLAQTTSTTIVIPGHGPVGNRADLLATHEMLSSLRASIAALKAKGMSIDDVVASKPTSSFDERWSGGSIKGEAFTRFVYQGV
jgi:glyoxylase-like metal-dependent hydrolase (beta-lactamase superfamily II)